MSDYWEKRAEYRTHLAHKNSDQVIKEIGLAYDQAIKEINDEIDKIFYRYADRNNLTPEAAKELLNQVISQDEYSLLRKQAMSIKDKGLRKSLLAKLDSGGYRARINRLEALKQSIYISTKKAAAVELQKSTARYTEIVKDNYYRNIFDYQQGIGLAYNFSEVSSQRVKNIMDYNWSGKHFSSRIWENSEVLATKLQQTLTSGLMSGKSYRRMADEIKSQSQYGLFAAERLIRTESAYMIEESDKAAAEDRGTKERKFVATLDLRTSKSCQEHDGSIVPMDKSIPGKNVPPLHPYCRSVMIEVIDGYEHQVRAAKDPITGKPIPVDSNMTYRNWYDKYVRKQESDLIISAEKTAKGRVLEPSKKTIIGHINNDDVRQEVLLSYMSSMENLDHEEAVTILKNGDIIKLESADKGAIRDYTDQIGIENLKGAVMIHNHPVDVTQYSFSDDDLGVFLTCKMDSMWAFDDQFVYRFTKELEDTEEYVPLPQLLLDYDGDRDFQHHIIISRCKGKAGYRRWKRKKEA